MNEFEYLLPGECLESGDGELFSVVIKLGSGYFVPQSVRLFSESVVLFRELGDDALPMLFELQIRDVE